jgi:hypothetical protein
MADNISIATSTSTTIAADDIAGVQYPRVKVSVGAPDSATDMTGGAGAVGAGTPRVTLASDDPAVAALVAIRDGTNTVNVAADSNAMKLGATSVPPKFKSVGATGSGDLIPLVSSKKIRVLAYALVFNAASTAKFQSGGSTDLSGAMPFGDKGGICAPFNPVGWFESVAGEKLNLVLGTSVAWAGHITYIEV